MLAWSRAFLFSEVEVLASCSELLACCFRLNWQDAPPFAPVFISVIGSKVRCCLTDYNTGSDDREGGTGSPAWCYGGMVRMSDHRAGRR